METFLADFAETHTPATVQTRYKCLKLFFAFLLEEREIERDPMANMKPPQVPEVPVPVLTRDQLEALLRTCTAGTSSPGGTMPSSGCSWTPASAVGNSPTCESRTSTSTRTSST